MSLNTRLDKATIEKLGIWQAATGDGYWENAATDDILYIYLLGQLKATESLHKSQGDHNHTRLRIKQLNREIAEIQQRLLK